MRLGPVVPNLFSLSRIVLTPFIALAILRGDYRTALVIFLAAAVTDVIDGFLARRFGQVTRFGAYVDPVTDKILLSTIYLCLGLAEAVPWWLVGIVFGRDVLLLLLAGSVMLLTKLRSFPPSVWGKASTFIQIVTAVTAMVSRGYPAPWREQAAGGLIWLAAATTTWSGVHYVARGILTLRSGRRISLIDDRREQR